MSDSAPKPTEPTSASDLYDEIMTMFEDALAGRLEAGDAVERDAAGADS